MRVFDPHQLLGAGIDGRNKEEVDKTYSPTMTRKMLSTGLQPLAYRLRTELAIEAWHWNPDGKWSDPQHQRGYWTSNSDGPFIHYSYGYRLPRRGNTLDEANNDGYSCLDDGDPATYWKSNPYLDSSINPQSEGTGSQWVAIDFGKPVDLNAVCIRWAAPFAKRVTLEWANAVEAEYYGAEQPRLWHKFEHSSFSNQSGDSPVLILSKHSVRLRYLRINLLESSHTAFDPASTDPRDFAGFAIREIEAGRSDAHGGFTDLIKHSPNHSQTVTFASSTDPWHTESDRDDGTTQPGLDLVVQSGLTRNRPMMVPLPVFYDTPENSSALVSFLRQRNYAYSRLEMGEEPDGQRVSARQFASLYCLHASAVRRVDPTAILGGPSFVTIEGAPAKELRGYHHGKWIEDFLAELRRQKQEGTLQFLSFEWYPFNEGLQNPIPQLQEAKALFRNAVALLRRSSLQKSVPLVIGEYGFSAITCRSLVDLTGALFDLEVACEFLTLGGDTSFLYGYEPSLLQNEWGTEDEDAWGGFTMFLLDPKSPEQLMSLLPTFHSSQMMMHEWLVPEGGEHQLFKIQTEPTNRNLSVYPVLRPDGRWAFLLLNKSATQVCEIKLQVPTQKQPGGDWDWLTFGPDQYQWRAAGKLGRPEPNLPPALKKVSSVAGGMIQVVLPPWSINVLRSP